MSTKQGRKMLFQDDESFRKIISDAEKSLERTDIKPEAEIHQEDGREKDGSGEIPAADQAFHPSIPSPDIRKSYSAPLIIAGAACLLMLAFYHADRFNDSLGISGSSRARQSVPVKGMPKTGSGIDNRQSPEGKNLQNRENSNLVVPQKPSRKRIVYDDAQGEPASTPSASPPSAALPQVPQDFHVVSEEKDGTKVYVNQDAEVYVLNPEKGTFDKMVRRHAP